MRKYFFITLFIPVIILSQQKYVISGELKQWHRVIITFDGPYSSETAIVNPFVNYRLIVQFDHNDTSYVVPGFFAADGNASETASDSGNKWRVIFTPDREGEWLFKVSFRYGEWVSVDTNRAAGSPDILDGLTGSFRITASDKILPDFRSQGMLLPNSKRYLQFSGSKRYFIKGGSNSPENFLAYYDFDQTPPKHFYTEHMDDWKQGDPLWRNSKGAGIIGAINYLSDKGVNSLYMLTFNVDGDGNDVWPYINKKERLRFDCSKLDQWDIVFSYMQKKGILCHFVTQETENDHNLDAGNLGNERKLYYRELIARFGYHPAVIWNLGEEITNSSTQIISFSKYIRSLDPYDHCILMHNINFEKFVPFLGTEILDGPSMYIYKISDVNDETKNFIDSSAASGKVWTCFLDEIGPYDKATPPDNIDYWHDDIRKKVLWGHLLAGGAGLEWYMGYDFPQNDLTLEDFRSRDHLWTLTNYALTFFQKYLPFQEMSASDTLVNAGNHCMSKDNSIFLVYLPQGGNAYLTLPDSDKYFIEWFNPRTGGDLLQGSIIQISGNGKKFLGVPPDNPGLDWIALVHSKTGNIHDDVENAIPQNYILQNYPNPFNRMTNIRYNLKQNMYITIYVYDILGNIVKVLFEGEQPAGDYIIKWDAGNSGSGIYFIRLSSKEFTKSIKSILLK